VHGIVDADPLVYVVGFGHDNMPFHYQCKMMDEFIEQIIHDTGVESVTLYLTGKTNFRYEVAKTLPYKGNRDGTHRPRFYKQLREYLVNVWEAEVVEGMEADDACGIDAYKRPPDSYIIMSIDKDLLMLEGKHYNYKRKEFSYTTKEEGGRYVYTTTADRRHSTQHTSTLQDNRCQGQQEG